MEWNKKTVLHFISLIRQRPAIWNALSPEYKIKQKRHDAVEEVAALMGVPPHNVHAKWTVLRNQFSREKRKMRGSDPLYTTKWFAYKAMEEIMSSDTSRKSLLCSKNFRTESDDSSLTSPPPSPPHQSISGVIIKRESDHKNIIIKDSLRYKTEKKEERHPNTDDDITSYGIYIAAHLRKFSPRLQAKARFKINHILYALDMENFRDGNGGSVSKFDNEEFSQENNNSD